MDREPSDHAPRQDVVGRIARAVRSLDFSDFGVLAVWREGNGGSGVVAYNRAVAAASALLGSLPFEATSTIKRPAAERGSVIIFPFGFYILRDERPVYLGNDWEARKAMQIWLDANPDEVCLRSDVIGPVRYLTKFLGCDQSGSSAKMACQPQLFETTGCENGQVIVRRRYFDHAAALEGHIELVNIAWRGLH